MPGRQRRRGGGGQSRRPLTAAVGPFPLDAAASRIVLLGLIASEALARCAKERAGIEDDLRKKVKELERFWPDEAEKVSSRWNRWRPVTCELAMISTSTSALIAAPVVTLSAKRDMDDERFVRLSLCARGLLRIETRKWPEGRPVPMIPKDPANIADAIEWAQRFVERAMPPLLEFVNPLT